MTEKDPQAQDAVQPQDVTSEQVVEDTLVEDVSIDGMCGVY
ncbi:mycofactocin precursor MftA [Rudaeicoccus suwonensis]|uniref:Mycofactocin n=1 Tax=Rudaeicoccus suwonensis TaxID=657409 RepID=A0A561E8J7_9MICO|nr:mycofactocin precursor MftA [Rudaeicoccus suwonensis]TWE11944.1 mycofactocin precursor [Rudaeicoccus suwonensis]